MKVVTTVPCCRSLAFAERPVLTRDFAVLTCTLLSFTAVLSLTAPASLASQVPGELQRYRAVSELTVGEADGPIALTRVGQIAVHGDRVFVSQPAEQRIRILAADSGDLLDEWGGRGDGPGEFQRLFWMGLFGDDLVVLDTRLHRVTRFSPDGSVDEALNFRLPPPDPPFLFGGWVMPTFNGNLIVIGDTPARLEVPSDELPWLLSSADGAVLDTLPPWRPRDQSIVLRGDGGAVTSLTRPIHGADRYAMAPDGTRFVQAGDDDGSGLSLFIYDLTERRAHTLDTGIPPVEVDRTFGDSIMSAMREAFTERRPMQEVTSRDLDQAFVAPEWVPAVDEMFVTAEGEVWLRTPNFGGGVTHDVWNVVAPEGTRRAAVEVPTGLILLARDGDSIWGFRRDEDFDFVMIERLRLEPLN